MGDQYDLWGNDEPLQWYFCKPIFNEPGHEEGPSSMVAVAWTWHNLVRDPGCGDTIWYDYDSENHRFIVQWHCHNKSIADGPWDPDSFEIILYDPVYYSTATGDGEIVAQYKNTPADFYDMDLCIGIENPTQTGGLEYLYRDLDYYGNGIYRIGDGAAPPVAGRVIKWTTDPPQPAEGTHPCLARREHTISDTGQSRPNGLLDPGETVEITVELFNSGSIVADGTQAILSTNSSGIVIINGVSNFGNIVSGSTGNNASNPFIVRADSNISYKEISFKLSITSGGGSYSNEVFFKEIVTSLRTNDPVGPDAYGYYAYDNTDSNFTECPIYEWFEIDPNNGGPGAAFGTNHGGQTKKVELPFSFNFYGQSYDSVTAASDGYISFTAAQGNNSYGNNTPLPYYFADRTMIAGLWDNMGGEYSGPQRWYYYSDIANHRFIIEYSGVRHYLTPNRETFQIILYDTTGGTSNAGGTTFTGDGEIVILYKDTPKELDFTTGIENHTKTDGIQYFYDTEYTLGASPIKTGLAIKFTTDEQELNPVGIFELAEFSAVVKDDFVLLKWRTEAEEESFQWLIQRKEEEAGDYVTIGKMKAQGTVSHSTDYCFEDRSVEFGKSYYYRLCEVDIHSNYSYFGPILVDLGKFNCIPTKMFINQNFPNPFTRTMSIRFGIPLSSKDDVTSLVIYDVTGRVIRTLISGKIDPGYYQVSWDCKDEESKEVTCGVYFYRLNTGSKRITKKMVYVK